MGLENGTYIGDLNPDSPSPGDPKAQGDDHLRLIKRLLLASFPNITGPMLVPHDQVASKADVTQAQFAAVLPAQGGSAGKALFTDGSTADWKLVPPTDISRSPRTANAALGLTDKGALVDSSGTFTQTFAAAATLGAGWNCIIRNSGTGDITLDPNGAELIDGLTSFVMYPGESRLVTCDGIGFTSVVLSGFMRVFTASGNFIKPPGYSAFTVRAIGGGGGGGQGNCGNGSTLGGCGGGGGAVAVDVVPASMVAASEVITVGAGGTGGISATQTPPIAGGFSSFGAWLRAPGGNGGGYYSGYLTGTGGTGFPNISTYNGTSGGNFGDNGGGTTPGSPGANSNYSPTGGGQGGSAGFGGGNGGAIGAPGQGWRQIAGGVGAAYSAGVASNGGIGNSAGGFLPGTGGGGGAGQASQTVKAGDGGAGGAFGGGGGGGGWNNVGTSGITNLGGNGGNGGNGAVVIIG